MMSRLSISLLIAATISGSLLLASCGTNRSSTATVYKTTPASGGSSRADRKTFEIPSTLAPESQSLLSEARRWIGTPYKYGGEDSKGIDCSGLVMNVYHSALQVKLPRNSAEQADYCRPIAQDAMMPGDLIFFDTSGGKGKKISHVGIYVGDGMMIHSSSSKGVIVSDINADYFKRTYAGAGYVEKYRKLVALSSKKSSPAKAATATPAVSQPKESYSDGSFTFTPVNSLPNRKRISSANDPAASAPQQNTTTKPKAPQAKAVTPATSGKPEAEPTPDEARKQVLNSLIEQKLDSIFNR